MITKENKILNKTSGKKWLITDTHWHHTRIIEYENRPKNFKDLIIKNWCNMVNENDEIYHLGDVIFKRAGELGNILSSLPGIKYLTRGNHDHNKDIWYVKKGFIVSQKFLYITYKGYKILLSHIPQDINELEKEFGPIDFNIHGHFHRQDRDESDRGSIGYSFYSDKHINLSIEEMNYKPIEIIDFLKLKEKYDK